PLLDAMLPLRAAGPPAPQGPSAPVRAAYLYFPNGAWMDAWVPRKTGPDYELPYSLMPLAPVRDAVAVLSGLDKPFSRSGDGPCPNRPTPTTGACSTRPWSPPTTCGRDWAGPTSTNSTSTWNRSAAWRAGWAPRAARRPGVGDRRRGRRSWSPHPRWRARACC